MAGFFTDCRYKQSNKIETLELNMNRLKKLFPIFIIFIVSCDFSREVKIQETKTESTIKIINSKDTVKPIQREEWNWDWHAPDIWSNYRIDTSLTYSFEDAFKTASELKVLYINEPKKRKNLPEEIIQLQELEELWLWINITDVEGVFDLLKELPKLKKLSIRGLKYIPTNLDQLSNLEALELNVGAFSKLPECICGMEKLRYIRLYNSRRLKEIPECISKLINLEYLDIAGTKVSKLSKPLGKCLKLKTITANACKIKFIDEEVCNLPILSHLNLGSNQIDSLPNNFGNLTKLDGLDLGSNRLSELPGSIKKMKNLQYAHLDENRFDEIPNEIFQIKNLSSLWIHGNKIYDIPTNQIANSNLKRILIDTTKINIDTLDKLRLLKPNLKIVNY